MPSAGDMDIGADSDLGGDDADSGESPISGTENATETPTLGGENQ